MTTLENGAKNSRIAKMRASKISPMPLGRRAITAACEPNWWVKSPSVCSGACHKKTPLSFITAELPSNNTRFLALFWSPTLLT